MSLDAPGLDPREIEQRVDKPQKPKRVAVGDREFSPWSRRRFEACANASSSGPSIKVSGVRNSCLTLEKNAGLGPVDLGQRLVRARSRSYSSARAIAAATCRPKVRESPYSRHRGARCGLRPATKIADRRFAFTRCGSARSEPAWRVLPITRRNFGDNRGGTSTIHVALAARRPGSGQGVGLFDRMRAEAGRGVAGDRSWDGRQIVAFGSATAR